MAFSTDAIANYFIVKAKESNASISPMKLQKLMYFAHGWHLALESDGRPLIREDVQAWEYGPVFPSTYHEFKDLGNRAIDRLAMTIDFEQKKLVIVKPSIDTESKESGLDLPFAKAVLSRVWAVYGRHSAARLSDMTHEMGSPWWQVREEARKELGAVPRALNIPNEIIRNWFQIRFRTSGPTATAT